MKFIGTVAAFILVLILLPRPSEARPHRNHHQSYLRSHRSVLTNVRPSNGETIVGGRRSGFPYAFCGAEASYYLFGVAKRELWLASNWVRLFPRALPAPGMAAARSGHVMILMSHVGGSNWLTHDGNSGNHLTREHIRSIVGYTIVNPHGARVASK